MDFNQSIVNFDLQNFGSSHQTKATNLRYNGDTPASNVCDLDLSEMGTPKLQVAMGKDLFKGTLVSKLRSCEGMSMASFHIIVATKMVATVVEKWKHWSTVKVSSVRVERMDVREALCFKSWQK